jgi:hypothetical protein
MSTRTHDVRDEQSDQNRDDRVEREQKEQAAGESASNVCTHQSAGYRNQDQWRSDCAQQPEDDPGRHIEVGGPRRR